MKGIEEIGLIGNELKELRGLIDMIEAREMRGQIEAIEGKEADTKEEIEAETEEAIETSAEDRTAKLKKKIHISIKEEKSRKSARPIPRKPSS